MKIKDIVNREIVNLTNCEQEPIHIPGSIQPHGFLLGLKEESLKIDFCSENCISYIGLPHTALLDRMFGSIFTAGAAQSLLEYISRGLMMSSTLLRLSLCGNDFLCTVHKSGTVYILEAEPTSPDVKQASQVYDHTSQFLSYMRDTYTLKELCGLVAKGTREITGYDRVMIYRFDKDYNGEIYAESCREDLEPFLGLHYPHTDIPVQARNLYMQNLLRIITDINYTPVPVYTVDDAAGKNLDLSLSILRSTSPIHVQYLQNMGVGATLTISLIYKKRLWGLIACHHYSPKNITPDVRLAAQLQGHFITSQIDIRQSTEEYEIARKATAALENASSLSITASPDSLKDLVKSPYLLEICNAAGVSILFNDTIYSVGLTPSNEEIEYLAGWFSSNNSGGSLHTDKLIDLLPNQKDLCEKTSGIIYHSLDSGNNNCIIWYRPETKTEVNWGGDPNKSMIKDEKGLSPRNSFELWKEIVHCMSKPWLQPELNAAASYAHNLQRQLNFLIISLEEEKYRKLSELLKEANSELENINWISTHDLQEPLRKIQLVSSRLLIKEKELSESVQDSIMRMGKSANRMQTLLVDILKYTRLRHSEDSFKKISLSALIESVRESMAEAIQDKGAVIIIDPLPQVYGISFLLKQLFSNLIDNSLKYACEGRAPQIKISAADAPLNYTLSDDRLYHVVYVSDNGIGFEQEYAQNVFNIFARLHTANEYKGSGVGLALCKKIMQNHHGYITAMSTPGEGTVMAMYFPLDTPVAQTLL